VTREPTRIPGCSVVHLFHHEDDRGEFVKVFQATAAREAGDDPTIAELFWSRSRRGVVRGLHFQVPPDGHTKLVTIITGRAFDVVVDLRVGSPAFGEHVTVDLDATTPVAVVVPVGCAHGFQATVDDTVVAYATSTEHAPASDAGIRWDSAGVEWPMPAEHTSPRDAGFPTLDAFTSPFVFAPTGADR
jgi:dTDP-4-dehydrorhamnose 3,5-epimerase